MTIQSIVHREAGFFRYPSELPITEKRNLIVEAVRQHQVLVITGETGSGKSTQIPKMCMEAGQGQQKMIGCTQPRRIAAITLANRVAEELGPDGARWVGYKIRFQDRTARTTRIKFMTDGILLAEAQRDRLFRAYDTLIVDEAHERSLNIDFLLGLIQRVLPRRPDLKVIITSATIDPESFSRAFNHAPILEVSGRTYPVEVRYRPPESPDDEETTYVDQAVDAVDVLKKEHRRGDILIFMPTESDIRETVQRLEEKEYRHTLVLPLFGRMAAVDQQRIFHPVSEEKIVVATNVAETSLTIPGIKYVIDTGLARMAQYNPRSRTQSLPIVNISQASADQRKGRCGRVEAGICIRLYSEEDYLSRPLYTPPEIQRSNLAEVILRMLFLKLGAVQDFPFIDPPSPAAVKDGFALLGELRAVDERRRLTPLGHTMAKFPLDPRLARILLQAKKEKALHELMILTAALSIQDPRERPLDQEAQADQAHAPFRDAHSDFVTLLKIWDAYERHWQNVRSQNQMRKFCRDHFLSYRRMREWRDIYEEIQTILEEVNELEMNREPASYEAIHRAVVSGYLSHIAIRREKNIYQATKGRQVMIFPGSGLFNKGGAWIVAAEMVRTSRLFARMAADIQPEWLEELGRHLCRYAYFEPHWEKKRGQVVAYEQVKLYGLVIVEGRKVDYRRIVPAEAREIFIRSALVEGDLPGQYRFMEHNRNLIRSIEELESKTRRRDLLVDEERVYEFYDQRIPDIADIRSFNKLLKDRGGDDFLKMEEKDLLRVEPDFEELERFPDTLRAEDLELPLNYAFQPGHEEDGVTVTIPVHALPKVSPEVFEWLVPGMLSEKITDLVKALPKHLRKHLVPVGSTVQQLIQRLPFQEGDLYARLSAAIQDMVGIQVPVEQWNREVLRDYLHMRFKIVGPEGEVLKSGRDLEALRPLNLERHEDRIWKEARRNWEKEGLTGWNFGDLPQKIDLGKDSVGVTRYAYPGLVSEGETVALRLFEDLREAGKKTRSGLMVLYRHAFAAELKQLRKDWVFPKNMASMIFFMGNPEKANQSLQNYLMLELFELREPQGPDRGRFDENVQRLRGKLGSAGREMLEEVFQVVIERNQTRVGLERFKQTAGSNVLAIRRLQELFEELEELTPPDFLEHDRRESVRQLPRYLQALYIRGERVYVDPEKDVRKAENVIPHRKRYEEMKRSVREDPSPEALKFLEEFRWMLEEYKISIFAPEIRTRYPVSAKRLEKKWEEWTAKYGRGL